MFFNALRRFTGHPIASGGRGFCVSISGLKIFFRPVHKLLSYLWIICTILSAELSLFSCVCAMSCSCVTIAAAWLAYRPLASGALFLTAGAVLVAADRYAAAQAAA